ncbi:transporter substrate-binding domain-containing protein [Acuticoccus mangrovi]|uniref:Transporter substrate-binding domain-containing protein n=1 Tax=Acuticoccus mangrovi TaxID=2796142 RepID=A0A934IMT7_9HYPH|nr:transporter substrate-binding domain-containing protein [Acuticoccus mangrovi]MBJ3775326.1 transporter substrate-binding domain-containing protein [Acuticoccus mangrovi]
MFDTFDRRTFLTLVGGVVAVAGVLGAGSAAHAQALDAIRDAGRIRVGYFQAAPVSFSDASGELMGTSFDLLKRIVAENDLGEIEPVLLEFDGLIPGLVAGRFDVVVGSLAIKPTRCTVIDYSKPDMVVSSAIAVKKGNPLGLHSFADIAADPKIRLGGVAQTYEVSTAKKAGVADAQITVFPSDDAMIAGLAAGRVDAVVSVGTLLVSTVQRNADAGVEVVQDFEVPVIDGKPDISPGGYGFRKGVSDELIALFDKTIDEALTSGWQLENFEKYGLGASSLPSVEMQAADYCKG